MTQRLAAQLGMTNAAAHLRLVFPDDDFSVSLLQVHWLSPGKGQLIASQDISAYGPEFGLLVKEASKKSGNLADPSQPQAPAAESQNLAEIAPGREVPQEEVVVPEEDSESDMELDVPEDLVPPVADRVNMEEPPSKRMRVEEAAVEGSFEDGVPCQGAKADAVNFLQQREGFSFALADDGKFVLKMEQSKRRCTPCAVWATNQGDLMAKTDPTSVEWNPISYTKCCLLEDEAEDPVLTNMKALLTQHGAASVFGKGPVTSSDISKKKSKLQWHFTDADKPVIAAWKKSTRSVLDLIFAPCMQATCL